MTIPDVSRFFARALLLTMIVSVPGRAFADGAFPDAQSILTPPDRPLEILVATNFGVLFSQDGGTSWFWTCEQDANSFGWLYQIGRAPRHRVFALANKTLAYSDDLTCGWRLAGGAVVGEEISDAWVDRALSDRVLAIGVRCCAPDSNNVYSVFESIDGGTTFGPARYVTAGGDTITGIESSISDSRIIYMTMSLGTDYRPGLARSSDGGASWQVHDLTPGLGAGNLRLIAVDAQNPNKVFLLWNDAIMGQALAVSEDGGATASIRLPAVSNGAVIKAFQRAPSGALLVATDTNGAVDLYRSRDEAATFQLVPGAPRIRGFSQRGALVYAATDNFTDGYALATSADDGTSWKPLMSYDQVRAIAGCVKAACQNLCALQVPSLWSADVCAAEMPPYSPDPPRGGRAGRSDGSDGSDAAAGTHGGPDPGSSSGSGGSAGARSTAGGGCACDVAAPRPRPGSVLLALLTLALLRAALRPRRPLPDRRWCDRRRATSRGDRDRG